MKDLTVGNETKLIFYFSLPMLIGNIFQQLYNIVDSIIVGQFIGKHALAAVGAGFPIMFMMISLVIGITMGTTVIISQYFGAGDIEKVKRAIDTAHIFVFISSIIITAAGIYASEPLLRLLNTPEEIMKESVIYLQIIFGGTIFLFGFNTVAAILRGLGDSKTPLYFLILSTIINAALVLLFVIVFRWGVAGAALATVLSQGAAFVLGVIYLEKSSHEILRFRIKNIIFDRDIFYKSIQIGLPTGIQQTLVSMGMMAIAAIVNRFGTDVIAAFTAAGRLDSFAMMPAMNLSMALSTFTGQNMGAGKQDRVKKGYIATLLLSSAIALVTGLVAILFSRELMSIFTKDLNVIEIGADYILIVSSFYILFSIMFTNNGIFRGSGDTLVSMFISLFALWLVRIPLAAFLSDKIGVSGIWWSIPAGWSTGMILSTIYYKTGRWKKKVIVVREELEVIDKVEKTSCPI
jgi:putative MATE family efflux protein